MAFNVDSFRSSMKLDGARPNLFEVNMSTANFLGLGIEINPEIVFKCRAASLPEVNLGTVVVNYMGREVKLAGNRTFPEWQITVINDEDFLIRNFFEKWSNAINSHVGNLRNPQARKIAGGNDSYVCDATISQFNKFGNKSKLYKFVGCWPTNVSAIDMDWSTNDSIEEFTVTLAFQWWEASATSGDGTMSGQTTDVAPTEIQNTTSGPIGATQAF